MALPVDLRFDDATRSAEADALSELLSDGRSVAICVAICGGGFAEAVTWTESRDHEEKGWDAQRVVQRYAAPHLRPSSILARATAQPPPASSDATCEVRDGADEGRWCWSLNALLVYAQQIEPIAD